MSNKIIEPVFPKQKNGNIFHVIEHVDWIGFTNKMKEIENKHTLSYIRFFVAYYNSTAYQCDKPISSNEFYSFLKEDTEESDLFRTFILADIGFANDDKLPIEISDIKQAFIQNTQNFIKENNLLDEFLLDKDLLRNKRDFSKADTTNIMLGLV